MASAGIQIAIDGDEALRGFLQAYPTQAARALVRALNRGIQSGQTVMVRGIAQDTGLRSSDVRRALTLLKASVVHPDAELGASLKRIPLMRWNARQLKRGGVSYRLRGGRGRAPHAFIATMRSGHVGVFQRKGTARLPIRELYGPSLGHVFARLRPQGQARVLEVFQQQFDHELQVRAKGIVT